MEKNEKNINDNFITFEQFLKIEEKKVPEEIIQNFNKIILTKYKNAYIEIKYEELFKDISYKGTEYLRNNFFILKEILKTKCWRLEYNSHNSYYRIQKL